jgi:hypothetical protein
MISKQQMEGIKSGGSVEQRSDAAIQQTMKSIEAAANVKQIVEIAGADFDVIARELATLRDEIHKYDPKASIEVKQLGYAEQAARSGNAEGIVENLRGMGRWVVDFASKIGVSVVTKVLEKAIGL